LRRPLLLLVDFVTVVKELFDLRATGFFILFKGFLAVFESLIIFLYLKEVSLASLL